MRSGDPAFFGLGLFTPHCRNRYRLQILSEPANHVIPAIKYYSSLELFTSDFCEAFKPVEVALADRSTRLDFNAIELSFSIFEDKIHFRAAMNAEMVGFQVQTRPAQLFYDLYNNKVFQKCACYSTIWWVNFNHPVGKFQELLKPSRRTFSVSISFRMFNSFSSSRRKLAASMAGSASWQVFSNSWQSA